MDILLIGAPGAGKGTQAEKLSQLFGLRHIASGDLFRKAFEEQTELGLKAQRYVDLGELVPDDITIPMVIRHIEEPESRNGVLLDGFPRTLTQAQALDAELEHFHRKLDLVIYLKVSRGELLQRIGGRCFCQANQHVYHVKNRPPKVSGICDLDGSKLYRRPDDAGEAMRRRLVIYFNQTVQVLDYYSQQQKLREIDGNQGIDQIHTVLVDEINAYTSSAAKS
ncbi:MAG TPA: adenylate kinase [Ktedonobacteraceae bacterium]|nr:adenylate kinase [Ktedonobacteraceae bacterium]